MSDILSLLFRPVLIMKFQRRQKEKSSYTVKKSVDFTVKYLATSCRSISRYFYWRLLVEHF